MSHQLHTHLFNSALLQMLVKLAVVRYHKFREQDPSTNPIIKDEDELLSALTLLGMNSSALTLLGMNCSALTLLGIISNVMNSSATLTLIL